MSFFEFPHCYQSAQIRHQDTGVDQVYRRKDNGTMATRPKAELKRIEDEGVRGKDEERGRGRDREGEGERK
jgi:hypothetical protein